MIRYETRTVYGRTLRYLLDADKAQAWYNLSGKRTITDDDLLYLRDLGIDLVEIGGTSLIEARLMRAGNHD